MLASARPEYFVRNLRRGRCDISTDTPDGHRLRAAFDDLALTI